jgi:hypothetical protein
MDEGVGVNQKEQVEEKKMRGEKRAEKKSSHVTEEGQIARSEGPFTLRSLRDDVMTNRRYMS